MLQRHDLVRMLAPQFPSNASRKQKNNIKNKVHLDRTSDFTISCVASVLRAYSYRPSGAGDHGCWAGSPAAPDVLVLSLTD